MFEAVAVIAVKADVGPDPEKALSVLQESANITVHKAIGVPYALKAYQVLAALRLLRLGLHAQVGP